MSQKEGEEGGGEGAGGWDRKEMSGRWFGGEVERIGRFLWADDTILTTEIPIEQRGLKLMKVQKD